MEPTDVRSHVGGAEAPTAWRIGGVAAVGASAPPTVIPERVARSIAALLIALSAFVYAADDRDAQERDAAVKLEAVRAEQRRIEAEREAVRGEVSTVTRAIREADVALSEAAKEVRAIERNVAEREAEIARLDVRAAALEHRLDAQRSAVAALLRSAYVLGRDDELKLVFAPDELSDVARLLAYHRYLQRDRLRRIEVIAADLAELASVRSTLETARAALEADRAERIALRTALDAERRRRRTTLEGLEAALADQAAKLAALGKDERVLLGLLERLRDAIADIPRVLAGAEPFGSLRGALSWPVRGEVLQRYGSRGDDGRVHEGLLIGASAGTNVGAVAHGRVAYADWLKGYGLLLIVDHGDGYMTLYAHAESLLRDVGEWVSAGDAIATAGASGGSAASGVYFELRRNGAPVDPAGWLTKR